MSNGDYRDGFNKLRQKILSIDSSYEEKLYRISYNVALNTNDWNRSLECLTKFFDQEEDPEFPKDQILS